uniref:Uncharacterized protein n=1 Tax=Coturnix japonica TaxID=93934 RepID=A0A8C2TCI2_COTJA
HVKDRGVIGGAVLPAEIQKLCDRVASSTLLDDRRDAVRALKALSKVSSGDLKAGLEFLGGVRGRRSWEGPLTDS